MGFVFEDIPTIPPYEDGEVGIPRTNLATFNRRFLNGQPREEVTYLYRLHPFKASYGTSYKSLLNKGVEYRNPIDNIRKHQNRGLPYIDRILERCAPRDGGLIVPRGTYYFASLEAASQCQYFNLSVDPKFSIDCKGLFTADSDLEALLSRLWILTRIAVADLPRGTFFADPNTQDSPDATLHVVDQIGEEVVFIPTAFIEVSIGREFINASKLSEEIMLGYITSKDLALLISRVLPNG